MHKKYLLIVALARKPRGNPEIRLKNIDLNCLGLPVYKLKVTKLIGDFSEKAHRFQFQPICRKAEKELGRSFIIR